MSIEKLVLIAATHYHANLIDIHNALHTLGLESDKQAEEFNKNREEVIAKHVITGVTSFESAKKAAAFMAGRELGFCITEEH